MPKLFNLAKMSTATTGAGTITLGSAQSGFLTFAQAGVQNGDVVSYSILDGANSEAGTGTYTSSGTTLTRNVISSTNSNAAINLSGSAVVQISALASNFGLPRSARTSNTILANADMATWIDITSGTFSQTFTAAATLGNGWWCILENSGTGDITLDPNSTETIDGLTTYVMYPQETRLVVCNGTGFNTVVIHPFYKVFTASGTFTTPPGYSMFEGLLWAAGGGGAVDSFFVIGGCGGACSPFQMTAAYLGASQSVTIGAGGAGGAGTSGTAGGNSTFAGITSFGGAGANTSSANGGSCFITGQLAADTPYGGAQSGSTVPSVYGGGAGGVTASTGRTVYGGGGGGGINSTPQAIQGTTIFGGAGGASANTTVGGAGTAPGGGGGSTASGANGGNGARGELRIWGVA